MSLKSYTSVICKSLQLRKSSLYIKLPSGYLTLLQLYVDINQVKWQEWVTRKCPYSLSTTRFTHQGHTAYAATTLWKMTNDWNSLSVRSRIPAWLAGGCRLGTCHVNSSQQIGFHKNNFFRMPSGQSASNTTLKLALGYLATTPWSIATGLS